MAIDFRSLQERLRQRLLAQIGARELTGLQLANETGFRQAHISNFLNRKRGLSLEAMDAILKARGISLQDLQSERHDAPPRRKSIQASAPGLTSIPLLDAENCHAREMPYSVGQNALLVMSSRLEKLAPDSPNTRVNRVRFVAMRVSRADAAAMKSKLTRGALLVIDRHSVSPRLRSMYLVGRGKKLVIRYVERVGKEWVLRADDAEIPLERLSDLETIVGRVCLLIEEL